MTDLAIIEPGEISPGILTDAELDAAIGEATTGLITSWRRTLLDGWRLGQLLAEKKRRIPYGDWLDYVLTELPIERSQTEDLMRLGQADSQWIGNLEQGTSVTAAVKLWRAEQRGPRPIPPRRADPEHVPLLRFMVDATSATVVSEILRVHFPDAQTAYDPTYGSGLCWNGTWPGVLTATDLDPNRAVDGIVDFTSMVQWRDDEFDVVVFDPPHLEDTGAESAMGARFGTADVDAIQAGVRECWRVARLGMICKVTDHVHGQLWTAESDWVSEALDWLELYDQVHQVRSSVTMRGHNWTDQFSAWNNGATWLIYRKGDQKHQART